MVYPLTNSSKGLFWQKVQFNREEKQKTRGSKLLVLENLTSVLGFFRIYEIRTFTPVKLDFFWQQVVKSSNHNTNNYSIIREYVKGYKPTPVKPTIDPSITDLSYDPNSTVKTITQQQKNLSELEIQTICERYKNGASSYELAKEFGCHRRTISDTLKRNGVEVSHQATAKPELVKCIIKLYAEMKTPKEVGAIVGVGGDTVRKVLKENGIYIRKSWEYPRK